MAKKPNMYTELMYDPRSTGETECVNYVKLRGYELDDEIVQKSHRTLNVNAALDLGESAGSMIIFDFDKDDRIVGIEILYDTPDCED